MNKPSIESSSPDPSENPKKNKSPNPKKNLISLIIGGSVLLILLIILIKPFRHAVSNAFLYYITDSMHSQQDFEYFFNKGVKYSENGNQKLALRTFKRILSQIDPNNGYQKESLYNMGVLYYLEAQKYVGKDPGKAQDLFEKAEERWNVFLNYYGYDEARKQQIIKARAYMDSVDEKPASAQAKMYKNMGQEEYYKKNYDAAIQYYQKALELDPEYDTVCNNLGSVYYYKNDFMNAVKYWEQAILINSAENQDLYLNIGSVYADKLNDPEKAIYFLERHIELNPKDPQTSAIQEYIRTLKQASDNS